jgi:hypothetical protein
MWEQNRPTYKSVICIYGPHYTVWYNSPLETALPNKPVFPQKWIHLEVYGMIWWSMHFPNAFPAFCMPLILTRSHDGSLGIATNYRLDGQGWIRGRARFFSTPQHLNWLRGPPSLLFNVYWWLFPWGVKQQGSEDDHSPPSSTKVKNGGAVPQLTHISSWHCAYCLIN